MPSSKKYPVAMADSDCSASSLGRSIAHYFVLHVINWWHSRARIRMLRLQQNGSNPRDCALEIHARNLQLEIASCEQLRSRGVDFVHHLGYRPGGITKGSQAARSMSAEAKKNRGKVRSVSRGGVCASLQSMGALSVIKPIPEQNLRGALQRLGMIRDDRHLVENNENEGEQAPLPIELPSYFTSSAECSPALKDDYKLDGYNVHMSELMLNESILPFCKENATSCGVDPFTSFRVQNLNRIENVALFERYKKTEARVARQMRTRGITPTSISLPTWLQKLSRKNGLCPESKSVYLLHGTTPENVASIVQAGLRTSISLNRSPSYGKGLYFTDCACKASQYGDIILVCRVTLGNSEILRSPCPRKLFPKMGFDSAIAQKDFTDAPHGHKQLHNEYVIYDDCLCYPEFVIDYYEI